MAFDSATSTTLESTNEFDSWTAEQGMKGEALAFSSISKSSFGHNILFLAMSRHLPSLTISYGRRYGAKSERSSGTISKAARLRPTGQPVTPWSQCFSRRQGLVQLPQATTVCNVMHLPRDLQADAPEKDRW